MAGKESFCPILWQANGGQITEDGRPALEQGELIRGYCTKPYDCFECSLMQNALANLPSMGVTAIWVCPACAGDAIKSAKSKNLEVSLPGYFTEGYCQRVDCQRPTQSRDGDASRYSVLLQLLTVKGTIMP